MTTPIPRVPMYDELIWPALQAFKNLGGSASNEELLNKVVELQRIPKEVQEFKEPDRNVTKLSYNLAWTRTYLKKFGAIDRSTRGVWSITDNGGNLTEEQCAGIPATVKQHEYERKNGKSAQLTDGAGLSTPSQNVPEPPAEEIEESWKDKLLGAVRQMEPAAFERLAQRLLRENGFINVEVTGRSHDGGIDGHGMLRVNLLSFKVLFQCKRYHGTVSREEVSAFRGARGMSSDKRIMVTTGTFSSGAKKEAEHDPRIDLIDGERLCDLLKDMKLGVETQIVINAEWFAKF